MTHLSPRASTRRGRTVVVVAGSWRHPLPLPFSLSFSFSRVRRVGWLALALSVTVRVVPANEMVVRVALHLETSERVRRV